MNRSDYWTDATTAALEDAGIMATQEQITIAAGFIAGAAENIGQAFRVPESPMLDDMAQLRDELKREREKVVCQECRGRGTLTTHGPVHSFMTTCYRCRGEGRHSP